MEVQVWDTYVHREDGSVIHFDILVETGKADADDIFGYGLEYLKAKGEAGSAPDASRCQFCHIETPTAEAEADIRARGYHIIEMDDIPAELPENPSRRDYILYLRGHYPAHRFADLRGKSQEELQALIADKA